MSVRWGLVGAGAVARARAIAAPSLRSRPAAGGGRARPVREVFVTQPRPIASKAAAMAAPRSFTAVRGSPGRGAGVADVAVENAAGRIRHVEPYRED